MRKAHAEHNEQVCNYIFEDGRFHDWVVTTAFYTSLHYVQHKIFPLQVGTKNYDNLNSYFSSEKKKHSHINKHQTLINLVKKQIPSIAGDYRWLYDICMTARYNDYNISYKKAARARNTLIEIKKACVEAVQN